MTAVENTRPCKTHDHTKVDEVFVVYFLNTDSLIRHSLSKLFVPQSRLGVRKYFFSVTGLCIVGTVCRSARWFSY